MDITHKLDHLVRVSSKRGCSIWLSMAREDLVRAGKEILRLREMLGIETPLAPWELEDQEIDMTNALKPVLAFDFETHLISAENVLPKWVCGSLASVVGSEWQTYLGISSEPQSMGYIRDILTTDTLNGGFQIVGHNVAFDLGVLMRNAPETTSSIFELLARGQVHDTMIREKLLNLADHGNIDFLPMPGDANSMRKASYSLAGLAQHYLGKDRTAEKKDADAWRLNYGMLDGTPRENWPREAMDYAIEDAMDTLDIYTCQEGARRPQIKDATGYDPLACESHKVGVHFALTLVTAHGMAVDASKVEELKESLDRELGPDKINLLIQHGIITPAKPAEPYKNGAKNEDGTPKMKKPVPEKRSDKNLKAYMKQVADLHGLPLTYTDTGEVSTKMEWFEEFAALDPVLEQYLHRQKLQKMVTTEIPRLMMKDDKGNATDIPAPVVHPVFDVVKETGRTSSFATDTYPSLNGQNVDPRARPCIVPRPGYLLFSVDYNQMELGTLAQECIKSVGFSVLAEVINEGIDVHEYMGAQLAFHLDPDYQQMCMAAHMHRDAKSIRKHFASLKGTSMDKFYKHYRKFAKPTNLGYPGGLGAETFVAYAKATYGVIVDLDMAQRLRELWMGTFTEMDPYFRFIKEQCVDKRNGPKLVEKDDGTTRKQDVYCYEVPGGLFRSGASFCAAANGKALQSPSAAGATTALFNVVRACYDPATISILSDDQYGYVCRPINFIHDEILGEVRDDQYAHDRVAEVGRIMVECMRQVTPDVTPRVEGCLMRRWYKQAEPVYDTNGRLIPWEPEE